MQADLRCRLTCSTCSTVICCTATFTVMISGAEIYSMRALTPDFCTMLVQELDNFNDKILQKSRPNTMNTSGVRTDHFLGFTVRCIAGLVDCTKATLSKI